MEKKFLTFNQSRGVSRGQYPFTLLGFYIITLPYPHHDPQLLKNHLFYLLIKKFGFFLLILLNKIFQKT